jgi:hypothetical protein
MSPLSSTLIFIAAGMTTTSTVKPSCWKNPASLATTSGIDVIVIDGTPILTFSA